VKVAGDAVFEVLRVRKNREKESQRGDKVLHQIM
jgi:hypothetical protein